MVGLPYNKNFFKICLFVLTQSTNVTDGKTDTHTETDTAWWHRPRLCIASRGKNGDRSCYLDSVSPALDKVSCGGCEVDADATIQRLLITSL